MAVPGRAQRAGPVGRARVSATLQGRPQGDPRVRRNANLLATNRRTAPGVANLDLSIGGSLTVDQQMTLIQTAMNTVLAALREGGLMETQP